MGKSRMTGMAKKFMLFFAALLALGASSARAANAGHTVSVFAAASLTNALQEAGKAYTVKTGVGVTYNFASSALLARQIEAGAAADLFVSADVKWMDHALEAGVVDPASRHDLLRGRLALIAPADSKVALRIAPGFALAAALGADGRLAVGDPASVPAGMYAQAALEKLGVWASVADRLARAENVRVALAYVARHEAPLGIVYVTDAKVEPGVRIVGLFPGGSHPPIVYPVALTRTAGKDARAFDSWLCGREPAAIFARYGFLPPAR